jgi:CRP/FNR family transcriptional regulator, cyclic AMP receptor protein
LPVDPLYLFGCGLLWERGEAGGGWELIQGLRSCDEREHAIACMLLSRAGDLHLPGWIQTRRQSRNGFYARKREDPGRGVTAEVAMNTPYGLEIMDSCINCKVRQPNWFCSLSPEVVKAFNNLSHQSTYPGGALLFVEGQNPRGAFVLCSGKVKLSTTSRDGKVLILKIAEAGDVLGLSAVISGTPYELSAETAGPCQVNFVDRESLINLLRKNGELGLRSAEVLSREFQAAYRDIHDLALARSSAGKLAKLLLSWTDGRGSQAAEIRIHSSLTHEEMAQMIGSSRETVTRLLSSLKKKQFIRLEGSTLVIRNRTALEALAA